MRKIVYFFATLFLLINNALSVYDSRVTLFNNYRSLEDQNPNLIFAGDKPGGRELTYLCLTPARRLNEAELNRIGAYQWMLNLKRDLDLAEYKMDWGAKELLGKELLETIGGKYGLTPIDQSAGQAKINEMIGFMDTIALHASIAVNNVAMQRKTTEVNKALLCESYRVERFEQVKQLEREGVKISDSGISALAGQAFINDQRFIIPTQGVIYTQNNISEFITLAQAIVNPVHNENIYKLSWEEHKRGTDAGAAYSISVLNYLERNFDFRGNSRLGNAAEAYFLKCWEKAERILKYKEVSVKLKLRDCNGGDIYGNRLIDERRNVDLGRCTFNSLLDLIRQNPGNKDFVTMGEVLSLEELRRRNAADRTRGLIRVVSLPFKMFNDHGQEIPQNQRPNFHDSQEFINLSATNDLSSRSRAFVSYCVFLANMNEQMQRNHFIKRGMVTVLSKDDSIAEQGIPSPFRHYSWIRTEQQRLGNRIISTSRRTITEIVTEEKLTPLHLLLGYFPSEREADDKRNISSYDMMYASLGMNTASFGESILQEGQHWLALEIKDFWNETTIIDEEGGDLNLPLLSARIVNPFAPVVGTAGANKHSKLVLQW